MNDDRTCAPRRLAIGLLLILVLATGCAQAPPASAPRAASPVMTGQLAEAPPPPGGWRGHRLARCPQDRPAPPRVEALLALCAEAYQDGSGSDGMIEIELALDEGERHPLLLFVLGQLYTMAGQGVPELLPGEGPAADTGDWATNRPRLLARARALLEEVGRAWPDEAAVDYLLADVARAAGRPTEAEALVIRGWDKCTGGRLFDILRTYQQLGRHAPRLEAADPPAYPPGALARHATGVVTLDVLLDPAAEVRQVVPVGRPDPELAAAAEAVFRRAAYEPARVGKYPVWAWLRVSTSFSLEDDPRKAG